MTSTRTNEPSRDDASFDDSDYEFDVAESNELDDLDSLDLEIAAYLDGEASSEARRAFEEKLERDPNLRKRLETERSAWDALDLLDVEEPERDLTEATVEKLDSETKTELGAAKNALRRRLLVALGTEALVVLAALALGFFAFSRAFPDVDRLRERDRDLVDKLDRLEAIGDFEFLKALAKENIFSNSNDAPLPRFESREQTGPYAAEGQDRAFYRRRKRFESLDRAEQDRLRELRRQIDAATNADELWKVSDAYANWAAVSLDGNERARAAVETPERRIDEIRKKIAFLQSRRETFAPNRPDLPNGERNNFPDRRRDRGPGERSPRSDERSSAAEVLRLALPEELSSENLDPIYQRYQAFRRERKIDDANRDDGVEFLENANSSELIGVLSPKAKKFLESKSPEERESSVGLLVSLALLENDDSTVERPRGFGERPGFPNERARNPYWFGFTQPGSWGGDSSFDATDPVRIRELADALNNAPDGAKNYVFSNPPAIATPALNALYWQRKNAGFFGGPRPNGPAPNRPDLARPRPVEPSGVPNEPRRPSDARPQNR